MSKGKRKSTPGALLIARQKLRLGTLTNEDRYILHQVSRLDLIALIEGELGVCLTGSQKNSVVAMVTWLLGPEGDGTGAARSKPRPKKQQPCKKKSRPDSDGPKAGRVTRPQASKLKGLAAAAELAARDSSDSWREARPEQQQWDEGGGDSAVGDAAHGSAGQTYGHSSEAGQGTAAAAAAADGDANDGDGEQAHWLRELQMQLAAAATADDDADDVECTATAQSSMQGMQSLPSQQQQQQQQQHLQLCGGQSATPPAITDDALESHLLQQLLQDMQLSPQMQQQQASQQPSPLLQLPQQVLSLEQQQQQQQQLLVQPLALPSLLPPQQLPLQHAQQQQQQQQQLFQHIHEQLQASSLQQLQPPRQLSPVQLQQLNRPSYSSHLPQATSGMTTQSCPLPNVAVDGWPGASMQRSAEQGWESLSGALPVWQQQQQQQQQVELSESASLTLKKRDRQQLFQQLLQGSDASAPLSVELSGPSADLTIKRRSAQIPGTESFSTMATAFAGTGSFAFAGRSVQSAPPGLAPPLTAAELLGGSSSEQQQQQVDSKQRKGLKKGMKGLAKRFKALLGGKNSSSSNSAQQQQQQQQEEAAAFHQQRHHQQHCAQPVGSFAGRIGSSASAPAAVRGDDGSMSVDLLAHIDVNYNSADGLAPPAGSRQVSTASAYSGRNPSGTSSMGYYQAWLPGTGSYPSWTGIGGLAYSSVPGQNASVTLQQHRLALSQQQQQQQAHQQSLAGSVAGTSAGSSAGAGVGSYENFGEKLKVLRAMYGSQSSSEASKPPTDPAAAGSGAAGGMFAGPPSTAAGGAFNSMEPLPALKEEVDVPAAAAAAPAAAAAADSSRQQFMQKLSKALRLGPKQLQQQQQQQEDEAGAIPGSGLSLTERSNSSFSMFLARVASGWRHENTSAAAATFHEDSYPPLAVGRSSFSHTTSVNHSLPSHAMSINYSLPSHSTLANPSFASHTASVVPSFSSIGAESSSSAAAHAAAAVAAIAAANAAAAAAGAALQPLTAADGLEASRGNFSRLRPASGAVAAPAPAADRPQPLDASAAAAATVEPSSRSFSKLFGSCAGGDAHHAGSLEHSRGSFSKLFGPCFDPGDADAAAAGSASPDGMQAFEASRSSYSRLLSSGRADSSGPAGAAAAAAAAASAGLALHGAEHSRGSFSKLFGPCASAQGLPGVEHSRGSFSRLLGAGAGAGSDPSAAAAAAAIVPAQGVEYSRGSFSKLLTPFGSRAGCDSSIAAAATAAAAGVAQEAAVDRSSRSFSKLLGPCGGGEFSAAALVEGSSRSFNKLFSSCSGCAGDVSEVVGGASAGTAAAEVTPHIATATAQATAAVGQAGVEAGAAAVATCEQQPAWLQQVPQAILNMEQQQQPEYLQQLHLQQLLAQPHEVQVQHSALSGAPRASLLTPAMRKTAVAGHQAAHTADPAADMLAETPLLPARPGHPSLSLLHMDEGDGI